jgi:hypothetical protein
MSISYPENNAELLERIREKVQRRIRLQRLARSPLRVGESIVTALKLLFFWQSR